jgi:hypothetical protein
MTSQTRILEKTDQNSDKPPPSFEMQDTEWIDEIQQNKPNQAKRMGEHWNVHEVTQQVSNNTHTPSSCHEPGELQIVHIGKHNNTRTFQALHFAFKMTN